MKFTVILSTWIVLMAAVLSVRANKPTDVGYCYSNYDCLASCTASCASYVAGLCLHSQCYCKLGNFQSDRGVNVNCIGC